MSPSHDGILRFEYDAAERAATVARSVRQEVGGLESDRSRTSVSRDGAELTVSITARDLTALRAALNTWQSLVSVAERCSAAGGEADDAGTGT